MKRVLKWISFLIFIVITCFTLVLLIPGVQRTLQRSMLNRVSAATSSVIRVGKVRGILSSRLVLEDVEFRSLQMRLSAGKMVISYHPFMLIWGYVNIDTLELSDFNLDMIREDKARSVPEDRETAKQEPFFKVVDIKWLKLNNGEFHYVNGRTLTLRQVKITAQVYHDFQEMVTKVTLDSGGFLLADPPLKVTDSNGEIRLTRRDIRFSAMKVRLERSVFSGEGYIKHFQNPEVYAKIVARSFDVKDLKFIPVPKYITRPFHGEILASGKISRLQYAVKLHYGRASFRARGRADFRRLKKNSFTPLEKAAHKANVSNRVIADEINMKTQDSVRSRYFLTGFTFHGELQHLNLADFQYKKFGDTDFNLSLETRGKISDDGLPTGNFNMQIQDSYFGPYQIFPSQINGEVSEGGVVVEKALLNTNFGKFTVDGKTTIPYSRESRFIGMESRFDLEFEHFNIRPFLQRIYLGSEINGKLRVAIDHWKQNTFLDGDFDVRLRLTPSTVAKIKIDEGELRAVWKNHELVQGMFSLKSDVGDIRFRGVFDPLKEIRCTLTSEGKDLGLLTNIFPTIPLDGSYTVLVAMSGKTKAPVITYRFVGKDMRYKKIFFTDVNAQGSYAQKKFDYDIQLQKYTQQKVELKGQTAVLPGKIQTIIELMRLQYADQIWTNARPFTILLAPPKLVVQNLILGNRGQLLRIHGVLDRKETSNFYLLLENIRLESFNHFFTAEKKVDGVLNSSVYVTGSAVSPRIEARMEVNDLELRPVCFSKYQAEFTYLDGQWDIKGSARCLNQETLSLEGRILFPFNLEKPWQDIWQSETELTVKIHKLPLDFVQNLWPVVETSRGFLTATVSVSGPLGSPSINVIADTEEGEFKVREVLEPFTGFHMKATASQNRMRLTHFIAETKQGNITMNGSGQFEKFIVESYDLDFSLHNAPWYYPGLFSALVEGQGSFQKKGERYNLEGNLEALRGTIEVKVTESRLKKTDIVYVDSMGKRQELPLAKEKEASFYNRLALDVRLRSEGNLWFKMDSSKAELIGDLRLKKEFERPVIYVGSIKIKQGYYDFLRNRFTITKGVLQFPGTPGFNPNLNIDGEYTELSEIKIMATVRGDLNNPLINLYSEPPQRDVEILSYLLFGKSSQNLTAQEASSVESQVLSFLGRATVLKVRDILGDKLTIDTLDIRRDEKTQGWRISVGKYLGRRLFVSYTFGFSPEAEDKLRLEYKLGRRWSIESEVSQKRSAGADLFWMIEY